ncbi:hypothetical protein LOD99_7655 [Oopsacas minuta]|uniref:Uncharacterized protein n=1 Tax=Oopsacas minuta TaxID=111878 RepID=A0AAV7JQB4_9METZ|nr:hypothetical protein LOD99_7655 [Oopsacas minuta]
MASNNSLRDIGQLDPLVFLKECKETAIQNGESKKAQQIRTLIWKIQDMSDYQNRKDQVQEMLIEAGLIKPKVTKSDVSEPSIAEKSIKNIERKLKDINKLKARQKSGVKLEGTQIEKISREKEFLKELESLKDLVASVDNAV